MSHNPRHRPPALAGSSGQAEQQQYSDESRCTAPEHERSVADAVGYNLKRGYNARIVCDGRNALKTIRRGL